MPIDILMPALSPTMKEGNLAKWFKDEGDTVAPGDVIAEIETDKATMEVESDYAGTLGKILVPAGTEGVKVNQTIGVILEEGEDASDIDAGDAKPAAEAPPEKEQPAEEEQAEPEATVRAKQPDDKPQPKQAVDKTEPPAPNQAPDKSQPQAQAQPQPQPQAKSKAEGDDGPRLRASPLARRMAAEAGIELSQLKGSGPRGRIVKADIEAAQGTGAAKGGSAPSASASVPAEGEHVPHSQMRKVIAARLSESKRTIPHYYLTADCRIDALMQGRGEINAKADGYKISVNDFVIRAAALALKAHPGVNAYWTDEGMDLLGTVDVAVAVALPDGLITPVIRNADQKGLIAISQEMAALAEKARDGKLTPEEYQGGGFTISNLGMYGVKEFSAVINPPQSAILAVGAGEQRPVVVDGALAVGTVMSLTLSCDHRVVDGALGARFLATLKNYLEQPLAMLL